MKSHSNSWCPLFPTTWIFERQFARNIGLWIFEWKFVLFDKWLGTFERNVALYLLCSNIPTHFLDDNLPSLNLRQWFFSDATSQWQTTNSCPFIQQVYTRLACITLKVPFTVYFTLKASQLLHLCSLVVSWLTFVDHKDHSLTQAMFA